MSQITDLVDQYANGMISFPDLRQSLRRIKAKQPEVASTPWGADDNIDCDNTVIELDAAAVMYDLTPDEYVQAAYSLYGQPMAESMPDDYRPDAWGQEGLAVEPEDSTPEGSVSVVKRDDRRNLVFGWANVAMTDDGQVVDHQGHLIDLEDLENAAYQFVVKYRVTGDMHKGEGFGDLVESLVVTEDKVEKAGFPRSMLGHWWVGFKVPPEHWDQVAKGDRMMFSIQGKATLEPLD